MFDSPLILLAVSLAVVFGRHLQAGSAFITSAIADRLRRPQQPPSEAALRLRGIEPPRLPGDAVAAAASSA